MILFLCLLSFSLFILPFLRIVLLSLCFCSPLYLPSLLLFLLLHVSFFLRHNLYHPFCKHFIMYRTIPLYHNRELMSTFSFLKSNFLLLLLEYVILQFDQLVQDLLSLFFHLFLNHIRHLL